MFTKSIRDFFKNPIIAIPTVVFSIVSQVLLNITLGTMPSNESILTNEFADPTIALQYLGKFMLFGLILMLLYLFISPIIFSWTNVMCREVVNGERPNFSDGLKQAFRFYWRMLGVIVLTFLIIMGVYIVFIILIAIPLLPLAMAQSTSSSILAVVIAVILFFVFLISMVFLTICLSPVQILLVYDDLSVIESISRGFKFGLKKFFPILGVFVLMMAVGLVITLPASLISPVVSYIASAITSYLGLFTIIFIMNLYKEYKNNPAFPPVNPQLREQDMEYSSSSLFDNQEETNNEKDDEDEPNSKFTI